MTNDDDAQIALEQAARRSQAGGGPDRIKWSNELRYRAAVGRVVLVAFLLLAHIVAVRTVTGWLIAHLVLIAILASQLAKRWLARGDGSLAGSPLEER